MVSFILFLLGLFWGSFLNVVIFRWTSRETLIWKRSYCPHCKTVLQWFELIPLISFFIQRGRCRSCGANISRQYPIVELLAGLMTAFVFFPFLEIGNWKLEIMSHSLWLFILLSSFLVLFFIDLREKLLPTGIVLIALLATLTWLILNFVFTRNIEILPEHSLFSLLSFIFFYALWRLSHGRWIGRGDANLAAVIGLALGWPGALLAFLFAFWSGAAVGLILVVMKKKSLRDEIPFGPFLIASATYFFLFPIPDFLGLFTGFL